MDKNHIKENSCVPETFVSFNERWGYRPYESKLSTVAFSIALHVLSRARFTARKWLRPKSSAFCGCKMPGEICYRYPSVYFACVQTKSPEKSKARSFANSFLNIRLHRKQLKETMCTIRIRMTSTGFYHRQNCFNEFICRVK